MPAPALWFQKLPGDLRRRLELAEARAREDLAETHARQALDLVAVLAPRMAFDDAVERYLEIMGLEGDAAETVGTRALALLSEQELTRDLARDRHRGWGFDWRYATPLGALRYIQRHRKRSAEEELWMELAAARAEEALAATHMRHALRWIDILGDEADPARAVSMYLDEMDEPDGRARVVYQKVLAHLARTLLPRLLDGEDSREADAPELSEGVSDV